MSEVNSIKLTEEELSLIDELDPGDSESGITIVEQGKWISDGKYEVQEIIFSKDDKFWSLTHSRTGSHYTEYYYELREGNHDGQCIEVEQVEIVVKKWAVKRYE